ncbi:hypothetical protein NDAWWUGD_CDS0174 [Salmonella phage SeKF_80]
MLSPFGFCITVLPIRTILFIRYPKTLRRLLSSHNDRIMFPTLIKPVSTLVTTLLR